MAPYFPTPCFEPELPLPLTPTALWEFFLCHDLGFWSVNIFILEWVIADFVFLKLNSLSLTG